MNHRATRVRTSVGGGVCNLQREDDPGFRPSSQLVRESVTSKSPKFVFVMLISSMDSLEKLIPRDVSSLLWVEKFSLHKTKSMLSDIVTGILVDNEFSRLFFWISHDCMDVLMSTYQKTSSVFTCIQQIKVCSAPAACGRSYGRSIWCCATSARMRSAPSLR